MSKRNDQGGGDLADQALIEFGDPEAPPWRVVTDGVMGGISQGRFSRGGDGTGTLEGHLSLENRGGFVSIRARLGRVDLSDYGGLAVRVRSQGQRYRLRVRTDDERDGIAYQAQFETSGTGWEIVRVPFESLVPTFRGRVVEDAPPFDPAQIRQLGFMIADGQEGAFRLEISWIRAFR
jgi:monofunctional biosynthetic peptidoglycan transglycosylase